MEEIAKMEQAYRRSKFVIIGHACFLAAALLVFGKDLFKLFYCRHELRRLRRNRESS